MKLSFDEEYRHAMCQLGGLQAIAELIQSDYETFGHYPLSQSIMTMSMTASTINDSDPQYHISLRRYAGMALTNLTFGDGTNKALLCSMKPCMAALVAQLESPSEELRQVTASVLRNLSWRADLASKKTLREIASVPILMTSAMQVKKESTLKAILSALWNLSAHCSENKADICRVQGSLEFLVGTLNYKSPSKTLSIVENGGGILRNISSHIAVNEDYRRILRSHHCLHTLLKHLKSESLTIVSNACGTLWNLSARCPEDQETLWSMGAVSMLKSLVHSKHKMISMGASAALKNLLQAKPNLNIMTNSFLGNNSKRSATNSLTSSTHSNSSLTGKDDMPTLHVRKQKALEQELAANENLPETCPDSDNMENASPPARSSLQSNHGPFPNNNASLQCAEPQYNVLEFDQKRSLVRNFIQNHGNHGNRISAKGSVTPPHQFFAGKEVESIEKSQEIEKFARSESAASMPASVKSDSAFDRRRANSEIPPESLLTDGTEKSEAFPTESQTALVLDDVLVAPEAEENKALSAEPEIVKKYSAYTESELEENEDQPTNFSLRYNEEEDEEESGEVSKEPKQNPEDNYQDCNDDAVKMYCTEDTPLNFSVATSLTDLTSAGIAKETVSKVASINKNSSMASPRVMPKGPKAGEEMAAPSLAMKEEAVSILKEKEKLEGASSKVSKDSENSEESERSRSMLSIQSGGGPACSVVPNGAVEKPSAFCVEGTPTCFSRVSSLSSLHSCEAEDRNDDFKASLKSSIPEEGTDADEYKCPKSLKKELTPPPPPKRTGSSISDIVNPSTGETVILEDADVLGDSDEKSPEETSSNDAEEEALSHDGERPNFNNLKFTSMKPKPSSDDPRSSSTGKTVSFSEATIESQPSQPHKQAIDNVVDTPLMFSRCSSVGSLSSMVDPNSVHDDRGSVVSDYSRLTSRAVSPSELPDSPSESMPSSPKRTRSPVPGLKILKPTFKEKILPSESMTKAVVERQLEEINQTEKLVPDDSTRAFWTEGTPAVSGGCSREFSETSSLLSALTINDGDDGEKAKLTRTPIALVNPAPSSMRVVVNATDVSCGKGGQVSLIAADSKSESQTTVADNSKSTSSAKSQTSSSITSKSSGSKSVISVKANDKIITPTQPTQEAKNEESDISEGEEDMLEAMIQAAKPTSSKKDVRDKNPKLAKVTAGRRSSSGATQSKIGKGASLRAQQQQQQLEKKPPLNIPPMIPKMEASSRMPVPSATRSRHLPGNKNSTGATPSDLSATSSPAMSTLNEVVSKPNFLSEDMPKTYLTEGTPKTHFSTATSLSDLTIDEDEPIIENVDVPEEPKETDMNLEDKDAAALSDLSLSDDESALLECIKSAMPTKSSKVSKAGDGRRSNSKGLPAPKYKLNQAKSKPAAATRGPDGVAKDNHRLDVTKDYRVDVTKANSRGPDVTKKSQRLVVDNALPGGDSVNLFASEGTPGLSHASSLSALTIDSVPENEMVPNEMRQSPNVKKEAPQQQHAPQSPESVSESPRVFSGVEGTPAVFSRNDSLSSLSCDDEASEDLGMGKLSLNNAGSPRDPQSLRPHSSFSPSRPDHKSAPKYLPRPKTSPGLSSPAGSDAGSQQSNNPCPKSPTGIPRLAHRRSRTPSVERVRVPPPSSIPPPIHHGVPSPGIHSPRAFAAVEGTPVCFSRNSSLSSLSLEEEEGNNSKTLTAEKESNPGPKQSGSTGKADDTMEEGEEALLDELVSAGLPKGRSNKKIPGVLLSKGGKKTSGEKASRPAVPSVPSSRSGQRIASGSTGPKNQSHTLNRKMPAVGQSNDRRAVSGSPLGRRRLIGNQNEQKIASHPPIPGSKTKMADSAVEKDENFSVISFVHGSEEEKAAAAKDSFPDGECLDDIELPSLANELGDSLSSSAGMSLSMQSEKGGKDVPEKDHKVGMEVSEKDKDKVKKGQDAETPEEGRWDVMFSGGWAAGDGENEPSSSKMAAAHPLAMKPTGKDHAYESPAVTTEERRKIKKEELLASLSAEVKIRRQQKLMSQKSVDIEKAAKTFNGETSFAPPPEVPRDAKQCNDQTYVIPKPFQDDSLNSDVSVLMCNDPVKSLSPEQQNLLMEEANMVACNIRQSSETKIEELMLEFNNMLEKGEGIDNETMSMLTSLSESTEDQTSSQGSNKLSCLESPTSPALRPRITKPTDLRTNMAEEAPKAVRGRRKPLYPGSSAPKNPVLSDERPTFSIRGGGKVVGPQPSSALKTHKTEKAAVVKVQPTGRRSEESSGSSQSRSNTFTRPDSSSSNSESSPTPSPKKHGSKGEDPARPPGPVRQSTFTKDSPSDNEIVNVPLISPSHVVSTSPSPSKSNSRLKTQSPSPAPTNRGASASARIHTSPPKKPSEGISKPTSQPSSHVRPRTTTPTSSSNNMRNHRSASRASLASNSSISTASVRGSSSSIASASSASKKAASTSNLLTHRVSPRDRGKDAPQTQSAKARSASSGVLNNPKLTVSPSRAGSVDAAKAKPAGLSKKTAVVSKIASLWKKEKKTESPENKSKKQKAAAAENVMTKSSTYEKLEQLTGGLGNNVDKKKQGTFTKGEASKMKSEAMASGLSSLGGWAKKKADKNAPSSSTALPKGKGNVKSSFYVTIDESESQKEESPPKKSPSTSNDSSEGTSDALQDIWVKRVHTAINLNDCEDSGKMPDVDHPQSSQESSDSGSVKSRTRSGTKTPTLERLNSFAKLENWNSVVEDGKKAGQQSMASSRATSPQPTTTTQAPMSGRTSSMATLSSFGSKSRRSSVSLQRSPTSESIMAAASTAVQIVTPFNWNPPSEATNGDQGEAEGATDASGVRGAEGAPKKSTCLITTV